MKKMHNRKLIVAAATIAASLMIAPAFGQFLAGQSGHANDANNQVGSGGFNTTYTRGGITPNQLIYGNVTNVLPFEGILRETDAGAFMGPVGGDLADNFIRLSSGAPTPYQAPTILNTPQPFYGSSRAVPPPIGTERYGYTGAYVGVANSPLDTAAFPADTDVTAGLDIQKQQLGAQPQVLGSRSTLLSDQSGQLNLNGPLEAQDQANIYAGSPLYGVRSLSGLTGLPSDDQNSPLYGTSALAPGGADRFRFQNVSPDIQKMRQELNGPQNANNPNGLNNGAQGANSNQPPSLNQPLEGPNNDRLNARTNGSVNNGALQNDVNSQENIDNRLNLVPARQQSSQYNLLEQRLQRYSSPQLRQIQANAGATNALAKQRAKMLGGSTGGGPTTQPGGIHLNGGLPAEGGLPDQGGVGFVVPPGSVAPLHIKSLADGVSAKGLHDLLATAEAMMRQNKFETAIQKYDVAQKVAPNNGLIPLGRANAELGGGYYHKASADLHQVFRSDPALLMGQYDLSNWLSADRLKFITKELTDLAAADKTQETPVFLLAYINYNTGHAPQAASDLKEAQKRAHGNDPLLDQLEVRWLLPQTSDPNSITDPNKALPDLNK